MSEENNKATIISEVSREDAILSVSDTVVSGVDGLLETLDSVHLEVKRQIEEKGAARSFRAGEVVAQHFEIVRPLGEGGMGEVFVARDRQLGRRVAIKTLKLPRDLEEDNRERFAQLFRRDAASTAQLNHGNIVTIYHFDVAHVGDGANGTTATPFFVLELVDGTPLDAWLEEHGCMPERDALELALQLCDALSYAHGEGVIHRDIKPANLMLTRAGHLKVLDFGIALIKQARGAMEEAFGRSSDQLGEHLGEAPALAGTPAYMAPEQLHARDQDARVDIWALGVTLFELITGTLPYNVRDMLSGAITISWPQGVDVSHETKLLLTRCMRPEVNERFASMEDVAASVRAILDHVSSPGSMAPSSANVSNLVPMRDRFIARQDELARLDAWLDVADATLATIVGPAGVGKSRLAAQCGARCFEQGASASVLRCDLGEVSDQAAVVSALAALLEVPLTQADPVEQLGWALERRPDLLLILDNVDRVLAALGELLTTWSPGLVAANVRVMMTARSPLELRGEQVFWIEPLGAEDARELFISRAVESKSSWSLAAGEEQALERLLEQLDHLPLAIELAASRARMLSPSKLLDRMDQRFKLLKSKSRDLSERQTTLEGAIAWSWGMLDASSRIALMQLSIFDGGCTLEAAEEIIDFSLIDDEPFVLDVLEHLVSVSLLRFDEDRDRFQMLFSVRAFAAEKFAKLPTHARESCRDRHAAHYAEFGTEDALTAAELGALAPLASEAGNFVAASTWALSRGEDGEDVGLRCLAARVCVVRWQGPYRLAAELYAITKPHLTGGHAIEPRLLELLTRCFLLAGERDLAKKLGDQAIEIAQALGNRVAAARIEALRGILLHFSGDREGAEELYREALIASLEIGEKGIEATARGSLGTLMRQQGRGEEAVEQFEQAILLSMQAGDRREEGRNLGNLGICLVGLGRIEQGIARYEQALELARELGDRRLQGIWLGNIAIVHGEQGRALEATSCYEQSLEIARELGDPKGESIALGNLGTLLSDRGLLDEAATRYHAALDISRRLDDTRRASIHLGNLGDLAIQQGSLQQASDYLDEALALARSLQERRLEGRHLGLLAEVARQQDNLDVAHDLYTEAREIVIEVKDKRRQARFSGMLGVIASEKARSYSRGPGGRSNAHFDEAIALAEELDDATMLLRWHAHRGRHRFTIGAHEDALDDYERALAIVKNLDLTADANASKQLLRLASALGRQLPPGIFRGARNQ